jgi:hypothetical protein
MKRFSPKIGDIFSVKINDERKKYFQTIAIDSTQLSSSVIRAFKEEYKLSDSPALSEVIKGEVQFYAHCSTKLGVKLNFWEKVGNVPEVGKIDHIVFRDTMDYGRKLGEEPVRVSARWFIWRINDSGFTSVGKLEGKYKDAEIGLVINPESIVYRMRTGDYDFPFYPGY